jgi:predicted TPR repeat methyltransferase
MSAGEAIEAIFRDGLALQEAGDVAAAAQRYGAVLRHDPEHFFALHPLGDLQARASHYS